MSLIRDARISSSIIAMRLVAAYHSRAHSTAPKIIFYTLYIACILYGCGWEQRIHPSHRRRHVYSGASASAAAAAQASSSSCDMYNVCGQHIRLVYGWWLRFVLFAHNRTLASHICHSLGCPVLALGFSPLIHTVQSQQISDARWRDWLTGWGERRHTTIGWQNCGSQPCIHPPENNNQYMHIQSAHTLYYDMWATEHISAVVECCGVAVLVQALQAAAAASLTGWMAEETETIETDSYGNRDRQTDGDRTTRATIQRTHIHENARVHHTIQPERSEFVCICAWWPPTTAECERVSDQPLNECVCACKRHTQR